MKTAKKLGPIVDYSTADLAFFAEWQNKRAQHKPIECCGGKGCWVVEGPPAIITGGTLKCCCIKCSGLPTPSVRAAAQADSVAMDAAGVR